MNIAISNNQYGKADVKLMKLDRSVSPHQIFDVSVEITLKGDMEAAFVEGDNSNVVPTDTMKNTVYIMARRHDFSTIEEFGLILARHFVGNYDQIDSASIKVEQSLWKSLEVNNSVSANSFSLDRSEKHTTHIQHDPSATTVTSGVRDLTILKSEHSGFENYVQDEYTTLKPTADRVLATTMKADWSYGSETDYAAARSKVREELLSQFSRHHSKSVQQTLYAMGRDVLEHHPEIDRINISMPNEHKILANLAKFGLDNENQIFVPVPEPFGVIEATLTRK